MYTILEFFILYYLQKRVSSHNKASNLQNGGKNRNDSCKTFDVRAKMFNNNYFFDLDNKSMRFNGLYNNYS